MNHLATGDPGRPSRFPYDIPPGDLRPPLDPVVVSVTKLLPSRYGNVTINTAYGSISVVMRTIPEVNRYVVLQFPYPLG